MPKINLKKITTINFDEIINLSKTLSEYQQTCVAPNVKSLAQAYVDKKRAWPRAIYLGKKPIGFIMLALWDDDVPKDDNPAYYLWRFMITADYQSLGYGRQALDLIKEKCKNDGIKTLYTSCEISGDQPYQFYINYGFQDTGLNNGEQILKLYI